MALPTGKIVAGMDEAGRGPWAGPLVTGAVILPRNLRLSNLNDSKKLTENERNRLYQVIIRKATWAVGIATNEEIDQRGLMGALNLAYQRALKSLSIRPDFLMIDGCDRLDLNVPYRTVIRGDEKVRCISAASIVAKVTRDRLMTDWDKEYPHFAFRRHKGYGTQVHREALEKYGATPLHRFSFKPVQLYG